MTTDPSAQTPIERYQKLLGLYRALQGELKKLMAEGQLIESELQKIVDEEKMDKVLHHLKNIKED